MPYQVRGARSGAVERTISWTRVAMTRSAVGIAAMPAGERELAERIHALVMEAAPELTPRTWYGMPAYSKDDKVVCFFRDAGKFKDRYATFGFNDKANLDNGSMWPTAYALARLTKADETRIAELVRQAVS